MNELSRLERDDLARHEAIIEAGLLTFVEVGSALLSIREARLYRGAFGSFEDYCRDRWGMSKTHANRMIDAAGVASNLTPIGVMPANEAQVRPLARLGPEEQREAWTLAVESAPDGRPTAGQVGAAAAMLFPADDTPAEVAAELRPGRSKFNETDENVDWARWTWNPVTGCEHTCVYCYARDIANRFYPQKFAPTFHARRLGAPADTKLPEKAGRETDPIGRTRWRNVFVCSMADLFGRWVPDEWIDAVFDSCRRSPEWNYLFLTKFPQRYVGLDLPATAWVGTSIDEQKRVANAEKAFRQIEAPVKWLSVEPMLEPITFDDLSMFDWVVIGGQSKSTGDPRTLYPDLDWIIDLIHAARHAGCAVYCKPNTDPGGYWAGICRQYPAAMLAPHPSAAGG
jgi:protein gp37